MSAHIQQRRRARAWASTALAAVLVLLAGCSGESSDTSSRPSVSGLRDKARAAAKDAVNCPVRYDVDKAAVKAGVAGSAKPGRVSADLDEGAGEGSPLSMAKGAVLECGYRLGKEPVTVRSVAVEHGRAFALMAPQVVMDAGMSSEALRTYLDEVAKTDPGRAVLTPSGNVATVGLPVEGTGDIALVVSFGANAHTALTGRQVSVMTQELAQQAKW